ncbi:hypothetical protein CMI37_31350 [Candidatus Pacearchaeota archaeon]|nr:hypothetical protein [Candidatus Pacearchaeota archaeon]|tara:strand:+ start:3018 stop:3629 length:612 start_codon:yes stop_codon:yes gene_type:complete
MIDAVTVACHYYENGENTPSWAGCYTPEWVDKLYRGVARNYSKPFRFVCLADQPYSFDEPVEVLPLAHKVWETCGLQKYAVEGDRLVTMGLDTVIVGSVDHIFAYKGDLAVPRDPYHKNHPCNAVVLCPTRKDIASVEGSTDMRALDRFRFDWLDDLFPGNIVSYKVHLRDRGHDLGDARIVYFHGEPKPNQLKDNWVLEHWK